MKTLLSLILVIFISVTTEALDCHLCESFLAPTCNSLTSETCPTNVTKCYANVIMEKIGPLTLYQSSKGCQRGKDLCASNYDMAMGTIEAHSRVKCCEGDNCNTESPQLVIPDNLQENGVECPMCAEKGKSCTSENVHKCTGNLDRCFSLIGGIYTGITGGFSDWTFKGCINKEVCDYIETHGGFDIPYLDKSTKLQCTKK
ncbi:phospholipase A2 inhibitor subunit gamma B-like [Rana temporaria]|uniref:phospholipase A2 inhibitor subunit gamma B-like n=1 Tax=Rana temporaria TaxID=8407 RepID=UPI001AAD5A62|nr:phospholipase A2 inhibitor subunit gamma B-like [Rana temporaria]